MNELVQPLRFHTSADYRLSNRHTLLNYLNFVPLIADKSRLLPFEVHCVKTDATINPLTTAEVINHNTGVVIDLLPYLTFGFYLDDNTHPKKQYIVYWGASTLPDLKHGVYYIHLVSADEEWFSDCFKIGVYNTIKIEYTNTFGFSDILFSNRAFNTAYYEGRSFDQGEYLRHSVLNKDENNYDIYSYRRSDKLRSMIIRGDSNVVDLLELAQMCEIVYITDETGKRSLVEISEIQPEPISQSNYLNVLIKYRIIGNELNTSNRSMFVRLHTQLPPDTPPPTGDSNAITIGGETITIGGEQITIGN